MELERYRSKPSDTWAWSFASFKDADDMVKLSQQHFENEIHGVFTASPQRLAQHLAHAMVDQTVSIAAVQLLVARDKTTNQLLAWSWMGRGGFLPYATEEFTEAKIAHLDQTLSPVVRVKITAQIIQQWLMWTRLVGVPVCVSTSIREQQDTFMRLHEQAGFKIHGSFAFKRV